MDYTATSGTLTFEKGETQKTVSVAVLDDDIDEGDEEMGLVPVNVPENFLERRGTGTIKNTDRMPGAWLSRFGRTVGSQAVDAISARMEKLETETQVRIAGKDISPTQAPKAETNIEWERLGAKNDEELTLEDVAQDLSFAVGARDEANESGWALWGEVVNTQFEGAEGNLQIEGDVTSGFLGAEVPRAT